MNRREFLAASGGALAIGTSLIAPNVAVAVASDRVRVATGLKPAVQNLRWIGTEVGIFKKLGLQVTFSKFEAGGPEAALGLIRGGWELAETGSSPLIQGVLDGKRYCDPAHADSALTEWNPLLVRPDIQQAAQLNGARIGVLTQTGQATIRVQTALRTWGEGRCKREAAVAGGA